MTNTIGFVVAMEKEARLLLNISDIIKETQTAGKRIYEGQLNKVDFVLIIAGVGKVNASMSTQILLDNYNIIKIINFGVAGGKQNSNLTAGDVVQVNKVCQYDFDLSELDNVKIGYMQDYKTIFYPAIIKENLKDKYKIVSCATGDRFTSKEYFLDIIHDLGAHIVDMESGAIAQVSYANNVPLQIIKLISDVDGVNESIYSQYTNNVKSVCEKIPNAIIDLI